MSLTQSPSVPQQDSEETFDRIVEEGEQRLGRTWTGLAATGVLGGLDVGVGVLALLLVEHYTHSVLLAGLAFGIGFIALTLARSELFTEGFLVPVAAVVAGRSTVTALLRLWGVTAVANLVGGWVVTGLVMAAYPDLRETARTSASFYVDLGLGWRAFTLALLGGMVITLMTHLQHSTDSDGVRLVPAVVMAFLLGAGKLNHAIVVSLLCFAALHAGASFGYADWLGVLAMATVGNMIGGLGLVTALRLLQVPHKVVAERVGPGRAPDASDLLAQLLLQAGQPGVPGRLAGERSARAASVAVRLSPAASASTRKRRVGSASASLALPHARVLLHQPSSEGGGQASDIEIQAREILRTRVLLERMLAEHTGRDEEQVRADIEGDKILAAEEAVAYGLVDEVIGSRKRSLGG